ncbi:NADAR family protein [Chryseolinea soli]|uniref:NADAR family protein n=1 Tax=Chryseolinea soli TaxID=2321403 RepID=A0A385SIT5_9BACT|nr:NADAR family protein [Chryseolinea soli]AYB30386.1 NADAR family protein [Chryseolinea soli]
MDYHLNWLKNKFDKGEPLKYIFFWGHSNKAPDEIGKFVFSQWYPSPFTLDGVEYKTAEHWMMAQKARLFGDHEISERILKATKPGEVKELGRKIRGFDEVKWNNEKFEIVKTGNIHKFNQNKKLKEYLLSTADRIIVEASPTDSIWGIGLGQDAKLIEDPHTWKGENLLGFAIMAARDFLRDESLKK